MPDAGSDVRIGLSSPGGGASFDSITYGIYFRGTHSGLNGDVYVDNGVASGVQYGPGQAGHLLGSGEDWSAGIWASATWSLRVTSATSVDFYADETLLYTWTGSIAFPLKVSEYDYVSGCARGVKWL